MHSSNPAIEKVSKILCTVGYNCTINPSTSFLNLTQLANYTLIILCHHNTIIVTKLIVIEQKVWKPCSLCTVAGNDTFVKKMHIHTQSSEVGREGLTCL